LKAGEPTRRSDTSSDDVIGVPDVTDTGPRQRQPG